MLFCFFEFLLKNPCININLSVVSAIYFLCKKEDCKVSRKLLLKRICYLLPYGAYSLLATAGQLDEISVTTESKNLSRSIEGTYQSVSDSVVKKQKLQRQYATLGNALAGELGVHSNPFGGASAPMLRGQEGVRVKILQNGLDVVDMSTISPDHAVAEDTMLAEQVELIHGANTLLYSTASAAGVINVVDKRIPTHVPEKGYEGEVFAF